MKVSTPPAGLTAAQVADRVASGRTNAVEARTGRTYGEIVRANVFTFFNGLLFALFVIVLATGRWQNALFGTIVIANAVIGIAQEVRAKRTLDRLAVLTAPRARAVRDGSEVDVALEEIVEDDLLVLRAGDQVPADAVVVTGEGLEIDESLLTGESDPVAKEPGEEVRSGSIVVAGTGCVQATAVGADAYATRIASEARRFTLTHSELVAGTTRLLRWITLTMIVVGPLLLWSQFRSVDNETWQDAVTSAVAALVGMVPEGLVLLTSLAFMIATLALARRQTLVQELPAIEGLARVDVVCLDKTGTLTLGDVEFDHRLVMGEYDAGSVDEALGLLSSTPEANATAAAVAAVVPAATWRELDAVHFSSARKWSATITDGHGTWVLGAPEMVLPAPDDDATREARARADALAAAGQRVLLLAHAERPPGTDGNDVVLPPALRAAALVVLAERIRDDAADTLRYFAEQGVSLKVISGDNPRTVGAVAAAVGLPGVSGAEDAIDARTLPEDVEELGEILARHSAFGRVTPYQKRAFVDALQRRGHVVAMTGDGVNDALALKDADIGVAMANGSPATRAVAQIVLLDGHFAHLPDVVAEGRRVIANIERAARLFVVKNVYSVVMAAISAVTLAAYPLEPIQLSLITTATIGIPGFFLALGPNRRRYVPGFLRRVMAFSLPAGIVIGLGTYAGYWFLKHTDAAGGVAGARTTALLTVLMVGLWVLLSAARPIAGWKLGLVALVAAALVVIVAVPALAHGVFLMDLSVRRVLVALVVSAVTVMSLTLVSAYGPWRRLGV